MLSVWKFGLEPVENFWLWLFDWCNWLLWKISSSNWFCIDSDLSDWLADPVPSVLARLGLKLTTSGLYNRVSWCPGRYTDDIVLKLFGIVISHAAVCSVWRAPMQQCVWWLVHACIRHSVRKTYRPSATLRLLRSLRISHNRFLRANKWILESLKKRLPNKVTQNLQSYPHSVYDMQSTQGDILFTVLCPSSKWSALHQDKLVWQLRSYLILYYSFSYNANTCNTL